MATLSSAPRAVDAAGTPGRPQRKPGPWGALRAHPVGALGIFLLALFALNALFADFIAPFDPVETNFDNILTPPNETHWFGTDHFGRDVLSRVIHGGRTALFIGFIAATVSSGIGLILGVASAYIGGTFDLLMQRVVDLFLAFPGIVLALAMISVFGTSLPHVILIITIVQIPATVRITRAAALAIRETTYIDAAKALGYGAARIILRHVAPNIMGVFLVVVNVKVAQAILLEASLSYLGLGVQDPQPAWGLMLRNGADQFIESAFWVPFYPGMAITITVLSCCFFGDSLRDALDPRLRRE